MQPEIAATKRGRDSRVAGSRAEVRTHTHRHRLLTITTPHVTATPPHIKSPVVCREGGSRSLLACCAGTFDATSSLMQGEPLLPRMPCLPAHQLTY